MANARGIPELSHGRNVLLGRDSRQVADAVLRALEDSELRRRLQVGGRETYERLFTPAVAGGAIVDVLEAMRPKSPRAV